MISRSKSLILVAIAPLLALAGISVYLRPKSVLFSYQKMPAATASSNYTVTVNGQSVPVELYHTTAGAVSFARFAFAGTADVAVTVSQPVVNYVLSPKNYRVAAAVNGHTLSFRLNSPQRLVLHKVNALAEQLFLLADAPEENPPQLGTAGVTDALTQPGINNQDQAESAEGITAALARLSAAGGGTLYVPSGVYNLRHSVRLPSNTTLYLAPGAVLQVDADYPCCFHSQGVITIEDASNVRFIGRGIVNGNAVNLPSAKQDFHMIVTENVQNLEIDGVTLLDQGDAALRLVDVHNSAVRNLKIIVNHANTGADGIDFDSSDHILIDNAFVYSSDDCTSQGGGTGPRGVIKDNYNLTVQNSVFYNSKTGAAFKIGTGDRQNSIRDITYSNINVIDCMQLAAFYPTFGANIDDVSLLNIRAETVRDRPFELHAVVPTWESHWNGRIGYIHKVNLKNVVVDATGTRHSDFRGFSPLQDVSDIRFTNFRQNGNLILSLPSAQIDTGAFVSNIAFQQ